MVMASSRPGKPREVDEAVAARLRLVRGLRRLGRETRPKVREGRVALHRIRRYP